MSGIFDLSSPAGLREKLKRDHAKLKAEPTNTDLAFNFFVTAEQMLDWVYPKNINKQKRIDAKNTSALLRVCSHLANGAKHFEVENRHHDSVKSSEARSMLDPFGIEPAGLVSKGSVAVRSAFRELERPSLGRTRPGSRGLGACR